MITSRRGFLRFMGAGGAAGTVVRWPLIAASNDASFETSRSPQEDGFILLDRNENAYGPSPRVTDSVRALATAVNRYPRSEHALREQIAAINRVKTEQVLLGCGSTEILRMAAFAFLGSGKKLIQATPTFEAVADYAGAAGSEVVSVPLKKDFSHDLYGMLSRIDASTTLVYICNPNNPTATLTPRQDLEHFISKLPSTTYVVIDEAYHHYAGASGTYASFIDRPVDNEKVIVTRTFSKVYGLAGLRLGYAVASTSTVQQMKKFAAHDNVNVIVAQVASVALEDEDAVASSARRNANDRQEFVNQAVAQGLRPIDSHANFLMMDTFHPAKDIVEHFRRNKILIGGPFPAMNTHIRISLGLPEEMSAFWKIWDALPYPKGMMHH
jgi:histidinol-phosphate aminotransferase